MKDTLLRILKIIALYILLPIVGLLLFIVVLFQFTSFQTYVAQKLTEFVSNKTNSKIEIDKLSIRFPKSIVLQNVYAEDEKNDTLLYLQELEVNVDMLGILGNKLHIANLSVENLHGNINRSASGRFNFDFIMEAFSSANDNTTIPKDTTTSEPLKITFGEIELKKIEVNYADSLSGMLAEANVGLLSITSNDFELSEQKFSLEKIILQNSKAKLLLFKGSDSQELKENTVKQDNAGLNNFPKISLQLLLLEKVSFDYQHIVNGQKAALSIGKLAIEPKVIDLNTNELSFKELTLHNSTIAYKQEKKKVPKNIPQKIDLAKDIQQAEEKGFVKNVLIPKFPYLINIDKIDFKNIKLIFNDDNEIKIGKGVDYSHLEVDSLQLQLKNIALNEYKAQFLLDTFQFKERNSGFLLQKAHLKLNADTLKARIEDIEIITGASKIEKSIEVSYKNLNTIAENLQQLAFNIDLGKSFLHTQEVLLFVPSLAKNKSLKPYLNQQVRFGGVANGAIDNLFLNNVFLGTLTHSLVQLNGNIKGLSKPEKAQYKLTVKASTVRNEIYQLAPKGSIPNTIALPERIALNSTLNGSLANLNTLLNLNTSSGSVQLRAGLKNIISNAPVYNISVSTKEVNLGYLLKNPQQLGKLNANLKIKGQYFEPEKISASVTGGVQSFGFNKYNYRNLAIDGEVEKGAFSGDISMKDKNLAFAFNGTAGFTKPVYKFNLDIEKANLKALGFHNEYEQVSATLRTDLQGNEINTIQGEFQLGGVNIITAKQSFTMDSLKVNITQIDSTKSISLRSDYIDGNFEGKIYIDEIGASISKHLDAYINTQQNDNQELKAQKMQFNLAFKNIKKATSFFVPSISNIQLDTLKGEYDSQAKVLNLDWGIAQLKYDKYELDNFKLNISSNQESLDYRLKAGSLTDSSITLYNFTLAGAAKENILKNRLSLTDDKAEENFVIGLSVKRENEVTSISLHPSQLILNKVAYESDTNNVIQFGPDLLYVDNFRIGKDGRNLTLQSKAKSMAKPELEANFDKIDLAFLKGLVNSDEPILAGVLNGKATLKQIEPHLAFTSNLKIENLAFQNDTLGNISLTADNQVNNYFFNLLLQGKENDVELKGNYDASAGAKMPINLSADIRNLALKSIEGASFGAIRDASGSIKGKINITGNSTEPQFQGDIRFIDAKLTPSFTGSPITLADEKILFENSLIKLPNFQIRDNANQVAQIIGEINAQNFNNPSFKLNLNIDDFQLLNTGPKDNKLYYGKLILATKLKVQGDANSPVIRGDIFLRKGTNLTYVIPNNEPVAVNKAGIVEFVDMDNIKPTTKTDSIAIIEQALNESALRTIDLKTNLNIDEASVFNIVLDAEAGDVMNLSGGGNLAFGLEPSGKTTLSGRFDVSSGAYTLKFYNLVSKKFTLDKDSYVLFTGNPAKPILNIVATYTTRTSPAPLISETVAADANSGRFNQKMPFYIYLKLNGTVDKPNLGFEIAIPQSLQQAYNGAVQARLNTLNQDEDELARQVFAVLITNAFLGPSSTRGGGSSTNSLARGSVSQILTSQLNKLSDQVIKGVDINFDVDSYDDFTTGNAQGRTRVGVEVSKNLFNDRVSVTVGSNVDVEGQNANQQQRAGAAAFVGNVIIEYAITKDGRYRFKAFRTGTTQNIVDGNIVETGVSIVFTRDYDNLVELLRKPPKSDEVEISDADEEKFSKPAEKSPLEKSNNQTEPTPPTKLEPSTPKSNK